MTTVDLTCAAMSTRIALVLFTLLAGIVLARAALDPTTSPVMQTAPTSSPSVSPEARDVLKFWRAAGPALWFAKDAAFDARFRERFLGAHEAAARGELEHWAASPEGALALVILLDQFPRNAFRGTPRMYDTDALARRAANTAFAAGYDQRIPRDLRKFFLLPFAHSEDLADQERAVALARHIGPEDLSHAEHHRDIVRRFGRFPHRNKILGRETTAEERQYLENGGYQG
jgi:uncharacterized protein (DUF924 family)